MITPKQIHQARAAIQKHGLFEKDFETTASEKEIRITFRSARFYFLYARRPEPATPPETVGHLITALADVLNPFFYEYLPNFLTTSAGSFRAIKQTAITWEEALNSLNRWLAWIKQEYGPFETPQPLVENTSDQQTISPLAHLHPNVQAAVSSRFADGYYSDALHKACTALEKAVQDKASQPAEPTGATLMSKVFSKDKPVLTVSSNQGEQEGYMFLYRGVAQAIRNHYAHNDPTTDPARALEWLSFISALFHKLDEATITSPLS